MPIYNAMVQRSKLPIVVYNLLTSVWRVVSLQSLHGKEIVMAQLLTNHENTMS